MYCYTNCNCLCLCSLQVCVLLITFRLPVLLLPVCCCLLQTAQARRDVLQDALGSAASRLQQAIRIDSSFGYTEPPRHSQPLKPCLAWVLLQQGKLAEAEKVRCQRHLPPHGRKTCDVPHQPKRYSSHLAALVLFCNTPVPHACEVILDYFLNSPAALVAPVAAAGVPE